MKPVGDRVLVKVDKEEMKSIGGVLLPANAVKKPTAGQIVAAGDVTLVKASIGSGSRRGSACCEARANSLEPSSQKQQLVTHAFPTLRRAGRRACHLLQVRRH